MKQDGKMMQKKTTVSYFDKAEYFLMVLGLCLY